MNLFQEMNISDLNDYIIFLDIDGTIANDDENEMDKKVLHQINKLREGNQIYLCSNSRNHKRNREISKVTNVEYIDTDLRKPSKKILDLVDHSPFTKRLVIGDKFLTDGIFAKNIKAEFIKVKRIISKNDKPYIRFLYWIDDLVSKIIKLL